MANASLETKLPPNLEEEEGKGKWSWRGWWVLSGVNGMVGSESVGRIGGWFGDEQMLVVMAIQSRVNCESVRQRTFHF